MAKELVPPAGIVVSKTKRVPLQDRALPLVAGLPINVISLTIYI